MKIGRNEPCACGSGKKYKRCCLAHDEQRASQAIENEHQHGAECDHRSHELVDLMIADELDDLSNQIPDLIHAGQLDRAEALGLELLNRFPGQIEGMERLATVYEARGEVSKAIDYYRKAATFATLAPGFDPEVAKEFTSEAQRLEKRLLKR